MNHIKLGKGAIEMVHGAIDSVFEKIKNKATGLVNTRDGKQIRFILDKTKTIPGLFEQAAKSYGAKAHDDISQRLVRTITGYLDGQKETVKTIIVSEIESFLDNAKQNKVKTDLDVVLGGKLSDIWGTALNGVKRIITTESVKAINIGKTVGIVDMAQKMNINDPIVYFICIKDIKLCKVCKRLHLLSDLNTPRVWKMSECKPGMGNAKDDVPSLDGAHINCRCKLAMVPPDYGFKDGKIAFISKGFDVYKEQKSG